MKTHRSNEPARHRNEHWEHEQKHSTFNIQRPTPNQVPPWMFDVECSMLNVPKLMGRLARNAAWLLTGFFLLNTPLAQAQPTNVPAVSDQPSLKLVASAEIQISRTGVFGEMTNFASSGSSKTISSFPDPPSTSKPWISLSGRSFLLTSSNAASHFL